MSYKNLVLEKFPDGVATGYVLIEYQGTSTEFCVIEAEDPDDPDQRFSVCVISDASKRQGTVAVVDEPVDLRLIEEEAFEKAWREATGK